MVDAVAPPKPRIRVQAGSSVRTTDSFQNFIARVGLGTQNVSSAATYGFNPISRNRTLLEWMYRGSWVVQRAVDAVAEDMTRTGIELKGLAPDESEKLTEGLNDLAVWDGVTDTVRWSRLFGGAVAIMLIDGQKPEEPLRPETVAKDQFKGLLVVDRWVAWPSLSDLVTDLGPDLGMPKFYDIPAGMPGIPSMRVHYSRVIRIDGQKLPYFQSWSENGWGASIVEVLYDRLVAFDSTTQGAAQLVYKAHLRTVSIEGLRSIIAAGGPAMAALTQQMDMIRLFQANEGLTLLDGKDKFEAFQYTFAGLDDVLQMFGDQLCGALRIPHTRLFGQSAAGMDATGEGDMQIYDEDIASQQKSKLKRGVGTLLQVAHRSILGTEPTAGFGFKFKPLRQMKESELADIAGKETEAVVGAYDAGIVERGQALRELRRSSETTGLWSTITDEEIEAADQDPPTVGEGTDDPDGEGGEPGAPGSEKTDPNAPIDPPDLNKLKRADLQVVA